MSTRERPEYAPSQLRLTLARLGVSGRELAVRLGVSPNWVSTRQVGRQPISHQDAEAISEALGVPLAELMGTETAPYRRRLAPVLSDVQDFLDDPGTSNTGKQFLLKAIRGLLQMSIEARDGVSPGEQAERQRRR